MRDGRDGRRGGARADRPAVLLVDDIAENLFALEATLRRDDVDLLTARSGREALEILLDRHVALAIVDVQMPEMDGFELAALMRGVEKTRHVPIIFVTAMSKDERRLFAGYETGAVDFLFKPIDAHVLRSKVDVFVELEKQQHELRRSEERFRTLVQATSQAVWRVGPEGRILADSPSFRELIGISAEDWMRGRWTDAVHPDDRARVAAVLSEAYEARAPYEIEYRLRRSDGSYTWTLARVAPLFDDAGEVVEWVGANTDIQPRKEAEAVREMFVGILGHDLRTPLGAMLTSAQLVLYRAGDDENLRKPLMRLLSSGNRMVRMIEQLLDLTRVRLGGGIALFPVVADLTTTVEQALGEIPAGKDRCRVDATGDTRGTWDVDRIFQVVSNLVDNAIQHSAPGTPIRIGIDGGSAESVELSVHNFGAAIPPELRALVFEPFRGATSKKRRAADGLGLGLFITRELVLAHGGSIAFDSSDRGGTIFRARLPRHMRAT